MIDVETINQITRRCTEPYRRGEEISVQEDAGLRVITVMGYPHEEHAPAERPTVDMVFITVGIEPWQESDKDAFRVAIGDGVMPGSGMNVKDGPSYIHLGVDLGSQELALRAMALGNAMGLWELVTPMTLGITGAEAEEMAGGGLIYAVNYEA